jgi:hypothetical protein
VSGGQRGLKTKRPIGSHETSPFIRQSCTGDTMIARSREMTGRSQTLLCWLGGGGVKTTENKSTLAPLVEGVDQLKRDGPKLYYH